MRAVVIPRFGGPDVLEIREVPRPDPTDREVLVRVHATALNRADLLQRMGKYPAPPGSPADIPGMEFAGEVASLGPNARRWRVGQRVFGIVGGGSYAEYLVVHEDAITEVPANLPLHEAAAVPEAFITAHDALVTQGRMAAGEAVLIHAVASGVGLAAVQLCVVWKARSYGTTRTADKLGHARALGLVDGLALDGDLAPLASAVQGWTGGRGIDLTLDLVGGAYFSANIAAAAPKGRIILVGTMAGAEASVSLSQILRKRLQIRGTVLRSRSLEEKIEATRGFEKDVVPRFVDGSLRPVVDSTVPLEGVVDAHRRMEANQTTGKIVLTLD